MSHGAVIRKRPNRGDPPRFGRGSGKAPEVINAAREHKTARTRRLVSSSMPPAATTAAPAASFRDKGATNCRMPISCNPWPLIWWCDRDSIHAQPYRVVVRGIPIDLSVHVHVDPDQQHIRPFRQPVQIADNGLVQTV
jgi:hypothetical protein